MDSTKSPMGRRPPLPMSPQRLPPRRVLRSMNSIEFPSAAFVKTLVPSGSWVCEESLLQPEYQMFSSELKAMAERVKKEFGNNDGVGTLAFSSSIKGSSTPLFERGRLYDEYSARRNERLKRKKGETEEEMIVQNPAICAELGKRRTAKKVESVRKSVPANFSLGRTNSLRSSVRNSKEFKKPFGAGGIEKLAIDGKKRSGLRSQSIRNI